MEDALLQCSSSHQAMNTLLFLCTTRARLIIELLLEGRFKGSLQPFSIALFPQETDLKKQ